MQAKLLGARLLLWGSLLGPFMVPAQEPAFISGDQAVRFEQAPGFFHYAAMCRTATEFKAQIPPNRLPREMTESAVCWYVMGSRTRAGAGAKEGPSGADGKLIVSEHHVRFIPHDASLANLYMDLHPQDIEMKHEPGQPFASLGTREILFNFRFSKLCPTCARGTPIPVGLNAALLEQEFKLVADSLKNFHAGWSRIYALSSKIRVDVLAANQPGESDSPADLKFYGNLNLHLAEFCSEPSRSCVGSFATYETCKALSHGSGCGRPPSCSASCAVSISDLQNLQARPCVQLDQQGASLLPDWSQLLGQSVAAAARTKPATSNGVDIQFISGSNPQPGAGCTLQASYLRASKAGPENAKEPDSVLVSAKPGAGTSPKPGSPLSPKPGVDSSSSPGSGRAARSAALAPTKPRDLDSEKSDTIAAAKPAPVSPAKSNAISSATPAAPSAALPQKPGRNALRISRETAVGMLVKKVSPEYPLEAKVARVQGTVVLNATISTTGEVSSIDVVSGPPLLQAAATNAVKQWQYKPFSFNGEPVEVETTIHVIFGEGNSAAPPAARNGP